MGKVIKTIGALIVLLLCGLFVFRCAIASDKSMFSKPIATERFSEAYADGESLTYTVDIAGELSTDGYFSVYGFYYNTESGEAQFAVRWNDSVYKYTDMESGHEFSFLLRNDTTGDEFPAECVDSGEKWMYSYRRLIAEGVSVGENDQLSAVMQLRDGFESVHVIKYDEQPFDEYKLKSSLLKELRD